MPESLPMFEFHFLRPWWLLLIPAAFVLFRRLRRAHNATEQWRGAIADHLLEHLAVGGGGRRRVRPYHLLIATLVVGSIAMAGPAWERELTPFTEDRAPLIVAIKLTDSMLSVDQQPTRLDRARQKLRDLLAARQGARTAVIAYAGSAHAVLPLTDDVQLLEIYVDALDPLLMPVEGDAPDQALQLAERMLNVESAAGTIVFMTDGIDRTFADAFSAHAENSADQIVLWSFGTDEGGPIKDSVDLAAGADFAGLSAVASAASAAIVRSTVDESDVSSIMRSVRTHLVNAIEADENLRWHDAGYYLLWPFVLLTMFWARRGWTVVWA